MNGKLVTVLLLVALASTITEAKVYQRCELVRTLRALGFATKQIPTWMCICQHESNYNTQAVSPGGDHGIFQINQGYWCNNGPTAGKACDARCSDFRTDDITAAARCAQRIYQGSGFAAWSTYRQYCLGDNSAYVSGC